MSLLIATIRNRVLPARSGSISMRRAAVERRRKVLLVGIGLLLFASSVAIVGAVNAKHGRPNNILAPKRVIAVGGEPRSIAIDGTRILVAGAEGRITELNASTAKPSRRIFVDRPLREIATFGASVVVVSDDGVVTKLDRERARPSTAQRVTRGAVVLSVAVNSRGVFVASRARSWIEQRSSKTLRVLSKVRLPGKVSDIIATPEGVWAAMPERGAVAFVPYSTGGSHGRPVIVTGYPAPEALAEGEGQIWVASKAPRVLWAINETTRTLSAAIKPAVIPLPSSVAVANGSVWVASADRDRLVQVGAGSGHLTDRFPVGTGRRPHDLVVDIAAVWTANYGDGTITRIDLDRLGAAHRLIQPADEPPRLAGVSRSVWVAMAAAWLCLAVGFGVLRWLEGLFLEGMDGHVPAHVRPLYADPDELRHLAGRQPIKEVVTEEQQRGWTARIGQPVSAGIQDSGSLRNEKVFDAHEASELAQHVIEDLAHLGKLHRDFGLVPLDDMTLAWRNAEIEGPALTAAMRARHDRLPDAAVLIERESWTLKKIDDKNVRMSLDEVRSRDGAHRYSLAPEVNLTLRLNPRNFLDGRGKRLLQVAGTVDCDVLAIVERRNGMRSLELTAVVLYTPVSDQVHLSHATERASRLRPRTRRTPRSHA